MKHNLIVTSLSYTFAEYKKNSYNIFKLANYNMHQQTLRTSLGLGWVFFRDIVYFTVFVLFRVLMSGTGKVEGMNFILFLMLGIVPWNFMGECINGGVYAIKSKKQILSSIKFPIIILPTVEIMAIFLKRLFTLIILFMIIAVFGSIDNIDWIMFIYYFFSMFVFMSLWNYIFSALVAISNDFENFYKAIVSVVFYTMPIIWSFEKIRGYPQVIRIFKLNPFVYIIEGFRDACHSGTLPNLEYTIYFWSLAIVLFCIGSILQYKLKNHYIDLI